MISYEPLWDTMKKKDITTYNLIKDYSFSKNTIYRLRHNMGISTVLLDDLCRILECKVEEILIYKPDNN